MSACAASAAVLVFFEFGPRLDAGLVIDCRKLVLAVVDGGRLVLTVVDGGRLVLAVVDGGRLVLAVVDGSDVGDVVSGFAAEQVVDDLVNLLFLPPLRQAVEDVDQLLLDGWFSCQCGH